MRNSFYCTVHVCQPACSVFLSHDTFWPVESPSLHCGSLKSFSSGPHKELWTFRDPRTQQDTPPGCRAVDVQSSLSSQSSQKTIRTQISAPGRAEGFHVHRAWTAGRVEETLCPSSPRATLHPWALPLPVTAHCTHCPAFRLAARGRAGQPGQQGTRRTEMHPDSRHIWAGRGDRHDAEEPEEGCRKDTQLHTAGPATRLGLCIMLQQRGTSYSSNQTCCSLKNWKLLCHLSPSTLQSPKIRGTSLITVGDYFIYQRSL